MKNKKTAKPFLRAWSRYLFRKAADTRGAVTIFMIVVLAGVFMFTAVFIDYSRIAAMEVQSERLTHAVLRSVMSAYEPEFQKEYGLFAAGESDPVQLLDRAIAENMSYSNIDNSFNLMPLRADTTSIQLSKPLGQYENFNQQIQEEMKYKAPIDFTIDVVEKMRTMSGVMKETTQTVEVLNDVRKPYERREKAIDELLALQKKAANETKEFAKLIMDPLGHSIEDKNVGSISSIADIAAEFNDYTRMIAEDKRRKKKDKGPINKEKISKYKSRSNNLLTKIPSRLTKLARTHEDTYNKGLKLMSTIRLENDKIKDIIQKAKTRSANTSYDSVAGAQIPGNTSGSGDPSIEEQLSKLRKNLDQLVLHDGLLNMMEKSIKTQNDDYTAIKQSAQPLVGKAKDQITYTSGSASSLKSSTVRTADLLQSYLNNYMGMEYSPSGTLGRIEKNLTAARKGTDTIAADEKKAKKEMKKATHMLTAITGLGAAATAMNLGFDEVNGYYEENMSFNQAISDRSESKSVDNDPYDESQKAMNSMDLIFGGISDALMNGRNEFFQNEYAIHYFEPFDMKLFRGLAESAEIDGKPPTKEFSGKEFKSDSTDPQEKGRDILNNLTVEKQQVEYIIYGFNGPVANLTAAYSEIFGIRLAIRTAEGLAKSAKLGHPLAVLAAGVLYGVEMALKDMMDLFTKGHTDLSGYLPIPFEYRDYLRLFLLQTNNNKKMSRMLALIRKDTGINPEERNTYASAHVRTGMKIWFLPGVMKMLKSGQANSSVEQGVYYAEKQADYSY